ncbi:MAG: magnesium/cobalt transporter CorA [Gammaproteobacteria bacterium]|nr:magnesium/cobalt transporter CorA [Gammaproteobacteria bacterium]MDH3552785.1 magnesium/cobalt transporter CorA [Gammaproteobacteria bacterium]
MALFSKRYHPAGTAPGTLTRARPADATPLRIRLVDYDVNEIAIRDDITAEDCEPYLQRDTVTWVHVEGQPTEAALRGLGASFGLHSLALEDVSNAGQRPKFEPFPDHLFIVMSLPMMADDLIEVHQVSLFVGDNFLISFCEADFTPFEPIVRRLQVAGGRIRAFGADYLMYSLLDAVIDHAFPLLETFGLQLEELEEQIMDAADQESLAQIHLIRRELILLRRKVWPQREVINQLLRDDSALVGKDTHLYLRDCYDHTIQVMDLLETYRDTVGSMLEIYMSSVSNRMNNVMRVLTVIATIFIPLTFIAGVYGMNFDRAAGPLSMPELGQPLGYVFVWFVMIVIAIGMIVFFRSRKWF